MGTPPTSSLGTPFPSPSSSSSFHLLQLSLEAPVTGTKDAYTSFLSGKMCSGTYLSTKNRTVVLNNFWVTDPFEATQLRKMSHTPLKSIRGCWATIPDEEPLNGRVRDGQDFDNFCFPQLCYTEPSLGPSLFYWRGVKVDLQTKYEGNRKGTSLVVQWLRLHAPNAGGPGSIPGWGTNIPYTTTKPARRNCWARAL